MRRQRETVITSPTLIGAVLLLAAVIGVALTYNASRGLPFVPTYDVKVDVPDAAELVAGGSEVRQGGARIGIVAKVEAEPRQGDRPPFARVWLKLDKTTHHLPLDTRVQVRPRSVLGAKYVDVRPGSSERLLPPDGELPLRNAVGAVELDEAFSVFDDRTSRDLRDAVSSLGTGFAGRGPALNETIANLAPTLPAVRRVFAAVAPDVGRFVRAAAGASGALAPVAPQLGGVVDGGARTFAAFDAAGDALPATIRELPPTELQGTSTLRNVLPVLDDARVFARGLRAGTHALPPAARELAATLRVATPVLRRSPAFADASGRLLVRLDELVRDPATTVAVDQLIDTVIATQKTLRVVEPGQRYCNMFGVWARNLGDVLAGGNSLGNHLNGELLLSSEQSTAAGTPAANLHANPVPHMNAQECEAGNEPMTPGRHVGNPPGNQRGHVDVTRPPPEATRRARRAGLVP
jgi:virulence factor Mce-like protein